MLEYGNDVKKRMQNAKKMLYKIWICAIMELNRRYDTICRRNLPKNGHEPYNCNHYILYKGSAGETNPL